MASKPRPTVYLVDGSSYIFRAYHAIRYLSTGTGVPTNAVFGVTQMLLKLLKDLDPTHIVVVLDAGGKNFRHKLYPDYKANRPPAPEDLKVQFPMIREVVQSLNLPLVEVEGVEADDVIATIADQALEQDFEVVIVSGDKDLMQLVSDRVVMYDSKAEIKYNREGVKKKLGVFPEQVVDLLALVGDTSDNIPGVRCVGPKTATKLLEEHGNLEIILREASNMKKSRLRDALTGGVDLARVSKQLASLKHDVQVACSLEDFARKQPKPDVLDEFLARMEFAGLRKQLVNKRVIDTTAYRTILSQSELLKVVERIKETKKCALDLETTSLDPMLAHIVGISLSPSEGEAVYIPVAHETAKLERQLGIPEILEALSLLWTDNSIKVYGQNIKYDAVILVHRHGVMLPQVACDAMVASYVLDPGRVSHSLDNLSRDLLGHETISYQDVAGQGRNEIPFAQVPIQRATAYAGEDADVTFRLCELLKPRVEQEGLLPLLEDIELPLIRVLVDMELAGIRVETARLDEIRSDLNGEIERLENRIYKLAGRSFNINSPAQLRVVLFDELGFAKKKKTKSGASTDSSVLEELAVEHELPGELLNYRSLAKLKSTYVDVLPGMINPETGRIHTSYNQTVTATGRLSSSNPNLQNIPIRTEMGRRIREAFVASEGCVLMSADYSQVELRILAHLSKDQALLEAFQAGDDIHARTAAKIFGTQVKHVNSEMRRRAKAVNFGIIYGQGSFNLSRQLGISLTDARMIIESYLERYQGVRNWVQAAHERARRNKTAETMFGRRRRLPDIDSSNSHVRGNAERIAQNTPIQGSAADIIKRAMIRIHRIIHDQRLQARMVLQVHDELVFDVQEEHVDILEEVVRREMEGAASLEVPLTVDISKGFCWAEVH